MTATTAGSCARRPRPHCGSCAAFSMTRMSSRATPLVLEIFWMSRAAGFGRVDEDGVRLGHGCLRDWGGWDERKPGALEGNCLTRGAPAPCFPCRTLPRRARAYFE